MAWEHLDDALVKLGRFGRFQCRLIFGVCLVVGFAASFNLFLHVFIGFYPDYRCRVPELDNSDTPKGNLSYYFPYECTDDYGEELCDYDYCNVYATNETGPNTTVVRCPDGFLYGGQLTSTIVSRWDLVCGDEFKEALAYSILSVGFVTGGLIFTTLSDFYGRKKINLISLILIAVTGIVQAFLPEYYSFVVFQFLRGNAMQATLMGYLILCLMTKLFNIYTQNNPTGAFLTAVVLVSEMFPSNMRIVAGILAQIGICIGMMFLALLAYLIKDYSWLIFTTSVPFLLSPLLYWVIPESVPWLVANNKKEEAETVMRAAAAENKVVIPDYMFASLHKKGSEEEGRNDSTYQRENSITELVGVEKSEDDVTLCEMFRRSRKLLIYFIASLVYWFLLPTVYYGITLNTSNLAGDVFLNFFLLSVVELPSALVCLFLLPRLGRKKTLYLVHVLPTVALAVMTVEKLIPHEYNLQTLEVVMSMVAKFGVSSAFLVSLFFTPEIFPTPVRNGVAGFCATLGTITNIIVPFIVQAGSVPSLEVLPYFIFLLCIVVSGFMVLFLPETLGRPMPQTAEEVEGWEEGICCNKSSSGKKHKKHFVNLQPSDVQVNTDTYKSRF